MLVLHLQVVERLDDDGGGRDRQNRAEKQRVHGFPAKELADLVADPDHQGNFQESRDERRRADLEQLAQAEFQPQAEHQENHSQLGQNLDGVLIVNQADRWCMRTDNEARHDITEHHWLPETVKKDGHHAGHQHDYCQVLNEIDGMHGGTAPCG